MDPALLDPETLALLRRAEAGEDLRRRLQVGRLVPGDAGVLEAVVRQVGDVRTYRRRRGGEGLLCKVTLGDATGEVDLVLWDDQTRHAATGPLMPGATVRLLGPTVRPGHRGGVELHLGAARLEAVEASGPGTVLEGVLEEVGPAHAVGSPPDVRFNAEARLATEGGEVGLVLWDGCLRSARSLLPGARVRLEGLLAHPALDGWFVADGGARLRGL